MPFLDVSSIRRSRASPVAFEALGSSEARLVPLIPVCGVVHVRHTTHWQVPLECRFSAPPGMAAALGDVQRGLAYGLGTEAQVMQAILDPQHVRVWSD